MEIIIHTIYGVMDLIYHPLYGMNNYFQNMEMFFCAFKGDHHLQMHKKTFPYFVIFYIAIYHYASLMRSLDARVASVLINQLTITSL